MIKLLIIFTVILIEFHRTIGVVANGHIIDDNQYSSSSSSSLVEINNRIGDFLCYGLLISDSWVLSRADCVNRDYCYEARFEFYRLKFGLANNDANVVEVNTTRFIVHPYYNTRVESMNNIALIHLPSKLILNDFIAPIHIPVIIGARTQNDGGLLTFMQYWYADSIIWYTRVTTYLQWIHDVTLIQETSI